MIPESTSNVEDRTDPVADIGYWELVLLLPEDEQEVEMALLELEGADSFWQEPDRLHAFFPVPIEFKIADLQNRYGEALVLLQAQEQRNWNAEWEAHCESIAIDKFCLIRPEHRPHEEGFEYVIEITPRMAFGTGHHETTQLMIRALRKLHERKELQGISVLDMGCGTGVLGILALMLGAESATLIDFDPLATEQTLHNLTSNGFSESATHAFDVRTGGSESLKNDQWQVILANINRNVLLADGKAYAKAQPKGGVLVLSGFVEADAATVIDYFRSIGYEFREQESENHWRSLILDRI